MTGAVGAAEGEVRAGRRRGSSTGITWATEEGVLMVRAARRRRSSASLACLAFIACRSNEMGSSTSADSSSSVESSEESSSLEELFSATQNQYEFKISHKSRVIYKFAK